MLCHRRSWPAFWPRPFDSWAFYLIDLCSASNWWSSSTSRYSNCSGPSAAFAFPSIVQDWRNQWSDSHSSWWSKSAEAWSLGSSRKRLSCLASASLRMRFGAGRDSADSPRTWLSCSDSKCWTDCDRLCSALLRFRSRDSVSRASLLLRPAQSRHLRPHSWPSFSIPCFVACFGWSGARWLLWLFRQGGWIVDNRRGGK